MIRHYSSIIFTCYPLQPSSISLLKIGNTFSISSLFDATKLQKIVLMSHRLAAFHSQCQCTRIFISLTNPMAMRTHLGFKHIERFNIHLSVPENYGLDTIICDYFYRLPFNTPSPPLWVLEGSHKRHHGYNYSYY